jgi:hypothetical protein
MTDESVPTGEKEYWHDKRLGTARSGGPSAPRGPDRQAADSPTRPVVTPSPVRTYRNLHHPIASFVLVVLAVILVGVGLLAVTGNGALWGPPVKLAACAPPHSALLGASGAQFTADFLVGPRPPFSGPAVNDWCFYAFSEDDGDYARPLDFSITTTYGQVHENGWSAGDIGSLPHWVTPSELRRVSVGGATGLEAFQCTERTDWCYGWLRVSRGRVMWVVTASGNDARLPSITAFVRSFRPVFVSRGTHRSTR